MKNIIFIIILSLPLLGLAQTAKSSKTDNKIALAVADLEGRGLAEGEASTLTDALRSYLIETRAFRVMERGKMDLILKEQGFQQSGACTDEACLVEMGQLLGVNHLVTGSIGKVGGTYSVNIRMINVVNGEIVRTANKFYKGEIDGLLTQVIPQIAQDFAATENGGQTVKPQTVESDASKTASPTPAPAPAPEKKEIKKSGNGHPVLWAILGVTVIGGGAAAVYFLLVKKDETSDNTGQTGAVGVTW
ncbi:MAG: hypothetical protein A2293_12790 [Elusimicrobia bacterium RIFOXYB2_FULL_49_7]|nr:MAG: hypothetical protein A2293_12790 [Elusimicrobia bacterium RIFOXYB2_FULL_49_7]